MTEKKQHGGYRKGAGRKPKHPGQKAITKSVSMIDPLWKLLDRLRGTKSRGVYIGELVERDAENKE